MEPSDASVWNLIWSDALATRAALLCLWLVTLAGLAAIHGPLLTRLRDLRALRRTLSGIYADTVENLAARRDSMSRTFGESLLSIEWDEFVRRWRETRDVLPSASRTHEDEPRAAVRLREVLDESPLLPPGPRLQVLMIWPMVLLGLGAIAAAVGANASGSILGALPGAAWGIALALAVEVATRVLRGSFGHEAELIDRLAGSAYVALSPSELATRAAFAQNATLGGLRQDLVRANRELGETLDAGLRRIETSTARAADLVSEEQKGSLRIVVEELRTSVRRAVERQVGSLQDALERAVEHQDAVSGGIAQNYERMLEHAETSERVAGVLESAASAVEQATVSISETVGGLDPLLSQLRRTGEALEQTAGHIDTTQQTAASTVATIRESLDRAAGAVSEQRELVEVGLHEIRAVVETLSDGLGEQLSRALHNVDAALAQAVERLRRTIDETNSTVDRLGEPVRSVEGSTRDMHAALDRVRVDITHMSQWLVQAAEPVRSTLSRIDEKSGSVARALDTVSQSADRIEKGLSRLGEDIGQQGSVLRAGAADLTLRLARTVDALDGHEAQLRGVRSEPPAKPPEFVGARDSAPREDAAPDPDTRAAPGWTPLRAGETPTSEGSAPAVRRTAHTPEWSAPAPSEALGAGALSDNATSSLLGPSGGSSPAPVETVADISTTRSGDVSATPRDSRTEDASSEERAEGESDSETDGDSEDPVSVDGPITYRQKFRET